VEREGSPELHFEIESSHDSTRDEEQEKNFAEHFATSSAHNTFESETTQRYVHVCYDMNREQFRHDYSCE